MENTEISWCDHTFNCWMGCSKVSPACTNCYAERDMDHRYGKVAWGPSGTRVITSDANWKKPLKWNADAETDRLFWEIVRDNPGMGSLDMDTRIPAKRRSAICEGLRKRGLIGTHPELGGWQALPWKRPRVFCASLADIFEDWQGPIQDHHGSELWVAPSEPDRFVPWRDDLLPSEQANIDSGHYRKATMDDVRRRLFRLIDATPHLDYLLLTKRPENIRSMWPGRTMKLCPEEESFLAAGDRMLRGSSPSDAIGYRSNCWLGTSVEDQKWAHKRIPALLKCRDLSPVLFLSCEPLLGPLDMAPQLFGNTVFAPLGEDRHVNCEGCEATPVRGQPYCPGHEAGGIDWVIAGGESGPNARPTRPDWVRRIREQCRQADVPFHFKQWGEWIPYEMGAAPLMHSQHGDMFDANLLPLLTDHKPVDQWWWPDGDSGVVYRRVGKKKAGRALDGVEHNGYPQTEAV